jgi:SAM-dependent methyltransferase
VVNTNVFGDYAKYYDLLYREKNYSAEVDYVEALIEKYSTKAVKTVLDLGCGTGGHAFLLAEKGFYVVGVDRSDDMLASAMAKNKKMKASAEFIKGDICNVNLHRKFDVAIAMFAVMGYQITNEGFQSALHNSWRHLNQNGLLIFDVWFGPAVISQKPKDKVLIIEKGEEKVIRLTRSSLDILKHVVDVNFLVMKIKNDVVVDHIEETHQMRFFFPMELNLFLNNAGYQSLMMSPFMEIDTILSENNWNTTVVAKKI